MDSDYPEKLLRGEREEAIRGDLKSGTPIDIKVLIKKHPRSSVYSVLKSLEKRHEGHFIKVELDGRLVRAFQLLIKDAPDREVELSIELLSDANPVEIRREAAKDLQALAETHEVFSDTAINFLVDTLRKPLAPDLQEHLFTVLWRITLKARDKGLSEVITKVQPIAEKALEIAKNVAAKPELREATWKFLIFLEFNLTEAAFELVTRDEEQEAVIDYVNSEIRRYAQENRFNARKKLYEILLHTTSGTAAHQRVLTLLQEIRSPSALDTLIHSAR